MTPRHLLVPTALAATAAALLGVVLVLRDRPLLPTLGAVLVAVAAGVLLAMLLVRPQPRSTPALPLPKDEWWAQSRASRSPVSDHPAPRPDRAAGPELGRDAGRETAQLVLPVDGAGQPDQWWSQDRAAAAGAPRAAPGRTGVPELASYRGSARVVQCPRCGAFRIDVTQLNTHRGTGYVFRCRVDDHEWTWQPGTAWPVTVVASRRRPDR